MRKDEKGQSFSLPFPQHSTLSWKIDETGNSKPSEDFSGLFRPSVGCPFRKVVEVANVGL